ncbi:Ig-like domain-containing protein [Terrimonas pollutisoli]|uniref:Ig-like domain-containing protein n=1 Tax=Terrimonas pollutisoli TaxID=3034147 RepID=UPI0023ECB3C3|nr:Ig-like domain-containing protein [Terrimonas sp. H1YJ31]
MKTILLSIFASFVFSVAVAQFSQNFDGPEASLNGNCWTLTNVYSTFAAAGVITGAGSMYTNPPTSGSGTRDIMTPALNITSTSFQVSFKYKVSIKLNGNATRTIEIGLIDVAGNFTSLHIITMDKNSATSVLTFNQTFTLASTGLRKLALRLGGATGDGNSRLIFDDLYAGANALYGSGTCNAAPLAVNDIFNGAAGLPFYGNVMTNDSDPNGEALKSAMTITSIDGVVVLNENGSFSFTPNPGFTGSATTFSYNLADNGFDPLTSNTALVTINFSNPVLLPVKLASFTAILNGNDIDLKWATSSEKSVSHFVIEKSIDGEIYAEAGIVFAAGNSNETRSYSFSDQGIDAGKQAVIYYRLRSVDIDGKSELSYVRSIRFGKTAEQKLSVVAYPNPVINELHITIPANWQHKKVSYEVYNNTGQVALKNIVPDAGQTEALQLTKLAKGFYIVRVSCDGQTASQSIIKQ